MPHSYVSNLMHCVFSTKERLSFISPELEARLWPYLGGIARENKMKAIAGRRHCGSCPRFIVFACDDEFCKSGSTDKRRIIEVGPRHI